MKRIGLLVLIIVSPAISLYSQTSELRKNSIRVSQLFISSDSYYNASPAGETEKIRTNSIYMTVVSGQYQVSDKIRLVGVLPVFVRTIVNDLKYNQSGAISEGGASNSVGDAEIGFSYQLYKGRPLDVEAYILLGLPFGNPGDVTVENNMPTGDGEFNQIVGLLLRKKISDFSFSGFISFNNRTEDFSDEIRYGLVCAYERNRIKVEARYNVIESLFNGTAITSNNGIFSNHREVYSPGVEIACSITRRSSVFASSDFILSGRNTLKAPLWGVGFQVQLD